MKDLFVHCRAFRGDLACLVLAIGLMGCSDSGPERAPISGTVTVGGKPLAKGRILFIPQAPTHGPATSAAIVDGEFKILSEEGAVVGQNRVEVEADLNLGFAIDDEAAFAKRGGRPLPPNSIPAEFNRDSTLIAEVKAGEKNQFDVKIPGGRHTAARPQY
jgi:hypothetical protein